MEQKLILVNINDDILGLGEKSKCHEGKGILHRAYVIFILCLIMTGKYNGKVNPNQKEVTEWSWVEMTCISQEMKKNSYLFTPWFLIAFEILLKNGYIHF